jgi:hypothetical protein
MEPKTPYTSLVSNLILKWTKPNNDHVLQYKN